MTSLLKFAGNISMLNIPCLKRAQVIHLSQFSNGMHLISLCVFKVAIIENFTSIIISDNVKCVSGSDEPTENYQLNLQLPAALLSFAGSFSSLFSCPAKVHD